MRKHSWPLGKYVLRVYQDVELCENDRDSVSALLLLEVAVVVDYLRVGYFFSKLRSL